MNLPCDGDKSDLSDFEGSEGEEGDATLNDRDEMDEFSVESAEEANSDTEDNPPVRNGDGFWGRRDEQTVRDDLSRPKKGEQGYDKIWKIRPMLVALVPSFQDHFYIGQNVSVDEIMIKGKGENPIKQYLPMKPIKHGSKIWALACSDCTYVSDLRVYLGKRKYRAWLSSQSCHRPLFTQPGTQQPCCLHG